MSRKHSFKEHLNTGVLGVHIVKDILATRYDDILDFEGEMEMQRRGVDLWVPDIGLIEVKADSHKPENFYFELTSHGNPGAIDRSQSDRFCVLFYKHHLLYFIPTPHLTQWLRENYHEFGEHNSCFRLHTTTSYAGPNEWQATGVIVPIEFIMNEVPGTIEIAYDLEDRRYVVEDVT